MADFRDRAKSADSGTVVISVSPDRRVQIDYFGPLGGNIWVELTPRNARTIARAILKTADGLDPPRRRR